MKIVVTGALGHIGSRLIRDLPDAFPRAEIVLIDDLSTQRYCSLFNLPVHGRYRFLEADVTQAHLKPILAGADAVIHLAAVTDASSSFAVKERVERVNFTGTERVAKACVETGSPLMFFSTTSVYGPRSDLVDEHCSPDELNPQSPYAESKLNAERSLTAIAESEGLRFVTLRMGTIFGTSIGIRFHTAVNKFCWQAVMGQPITVWRTALHQQRPYLDLGDAVEAIKFITRRDLYDRGIYNVVTTNASVSEIIEIISNHVKDVSIQYVDSEIMNQLSYRVSSMRFKNLGFEFRGSLDKGIADTVSLLKNGIQR